MWFDEDAVCRCKMSTAFKERKICQIKDSFKKYFENHFLRWETFATEISNTMNSLPLAFGSTTSDLDNLDLITSNRLGLGHNNYCNPVGLLKVASSWSRFLQAHKEKLNTWFENWLISYIPKLMYYRKCFDKENDLKIGGIILSIKQKVVLIHLSIQIYL